MTSRQETPRAKWKVDCGFVFFVVVVVVGRRLGKMLVGPRASVEIGGAPSL